MTASDDVPTTGSDELAPLRRWIATMIEELRGEGYPALLARLDEVEHHDVDGYLGDVVVRSMGVGDPELDVAVTVWPAVEEPRPRGLRRFFSVTRPLLVESFVIAADGRIRDDTLVSPAHD